MNRSRRRTHTHRLPKQRQHRRHPIPRRALPPQLFYPTPLLRARPQAAKIRKKESIPSSGSPKSNITKEGIRAALAGVRQSNLTVVRRKRFMSTTLIPKGGPFIAVLGVLLTAGCQLRTPFEYRIPNGYVGWVSVKCGVSGAGTLPKVENRIQVIVPVGGRVRTSSSCDTGIRVVEYWYIDSSGQRVKELTLGAATGPRVTRFTVVGPPLGGHEISGWVFWVGPDDPDDN